MFKIIQFNKPRDLEQMLNDKWSLLGTFMSSGKTYLILNKVNA